MYIPLIKFSYLIGVFLLFLPLSFIQASDPLQGIGVGQTVSVTTSIGNGSSGGGVFITPSNYSLTASVTNLNNLQYEYQYTYTFDPSLSSNTSFSVSSIISAELGIGASGDVISSSATINGIDASAGLVNVANFNGIYGAMALGLGTADTSLSSIYLDYVISRSPVWQGYLLTLNADVLDSVQSNNFLGSPPPADGPFDGWIPGPGPLIVAPVPEPSTYLMLGSLLGLGGLIHVCRKKAKERA